MTSDRCARARARSNRSPEATPAEPTVLPTGSTMRGAGFTVADGGGTGAAALPVKPTGVLTRPTGGDAVLLVGLMRAVGTLAARAASAAVERCDAQIAVEAPNTAPTSAAIVACMTRLDRICTQTLVTWSDPRS